MTPVKHCQVSQNRWGGVLEDYLAVHEFIDSTKALCADNRHRVLHTHWAIDYVILPLFGRTLTNSEGKRVPLKELIEQDHILPDYRNRFIPTLNDFVSAIEDEGLDDTKQRLDTFHLKYANPEISALLLSPLAVTGKVKSLLVTHNSWFINTIVPALYPQSPTINEFDLSPADLFERMKLELWMDNGADYPRSVPKNIRIRSQASLS